MSENKVSIIGAGITGIFTALYLKKAGYQVTLFDKSDGMDNCSYGNAGMIVPSHVIPLASPGMISKGLRWMLKRDSPFYIRPRLDTDLIKWGLAFRKNSTQEHVERAGAVLHHLLTRSRHLYSEFNEEADFDFGFTEKGLYIFCNSEKGLDSEIRDAEQANRLGVRTEVLSAEDVAERIPGLQLNIKGGVHYPDDAHMHPGLLMDGLKKWLAGRDVTFHYQTEVTFLERSRDRILRLKTADGRTYESGHFILCNGVWSHQLGKTVGKNLLMQGGKGYSMTLQNPPHLPDICGILSERKVTFTPMAGNLRVAGTMEIAGSDITANPVRVESIKKAVCDYMPQFRMTDFSNARVWAGLRPIAPDGMPYAGRSRDYKNLYISTGHAMMGMSLAPACGQLITDLITTGSSELSHPLISPDRFR